MKVLFYSKGLVNPRGGAQTAARKQFEAILDIEKDKNIQLYAITDYSSGKIKGNNVFPIFPYIFKFIIFSFILENYLFTYFLERRLQNKFDLIHIHAYGFNYPIYKHNNAILTFHDELFYRGPKITFSILIMIEKIYYYCNYLIRINNIQYYCNFQSLSIQITNQLKSIIENPAIYEIPNGRSSSLPFPKYNNKRIKTENIKIILSVGPLEDRKGITDLISIDHILPNSYKIVVIGKLAPIWGNHYFLKISKSNITYLGFVSEKFKSFLYQNVDLVLSLSKSEASQLSIIEALEYKTNVLMTNTGSNQFLNKLLKIPSGKSNKFIAKLITNYLNDPKTKIRNVIKINYPDWSTIANSIASIYQNLMS